MPQFLRYTTFSPEERERLGPVAVTPSRGSRLLKEHRFSVNYPDGTSGTCSYERLGPACHRFQYRYEDGVSMPQQYSLRPLGNTPAAIEEKGQELAEQCFKEAIEREKRDYFQRASEPSDGGRKKRPELYQMRAGRAKEIGGKYALCRKLGDSLLPVSEMFETLESANAAWTAKADTSLVVACCNRLDRCWQQPRYNPLHKEGHPRREAATAHVP